MTRTAWFFLLVAMATASNHGYKYFGSRHDVTRPRRSGSKPELPMSQFMIGMFDRLKETGAFHKKPVAVIIPKDTNRLPHELMTLKCQFSSVNSTEIIWLKDGETFLNESDLDKSKSYTGSDEIRKVYVNPRYRSYRYLDQQNTGVSALTYWFVSTNDTGMYQCKVPDAELRPGAVSPPANVTVRDFNVYGPTVFLEHPSNLYGLFVGKYEQEVSTCYIAGINLTNQDIVWLHNGSDIVGNKQPAKVVNTARLYTGYTTYEYKGFRIVKTPLLGKSVLSKIDIKWSDAGEYQCMVPEKNGEAAIYSRIANVRVYYSGRL